MTTPTYVTQHARDRFQERTGCVVKDQVLLWLWREGREPYPQEQLHFGFCPTSYSEYRTVLYHRTAQRLVLVANGKAIVTVFAEKRPQMGR